MITYLYILTQDVWLVFLLYLAVSKYGDLKLGKENEKPRYNDLTWFSMIFSMESGPPFSNRERGLMRPSNLSLSINASTHSSGYTFQSAEMQQPMPVRGGVG